MSFTKHLLNRLDENPGPDLIEVERLLSCINVIEGTSLIKVDGERETDFITFVTCASTGSDALEIFRSEATSLRFAMQTVLNQFPQSIRQELDEVHARAGHAAASSGNTSGRSGKIRSLDKFSDSANSDFLAVESLFSELSQNGTIWSVATNSTDRHLSYSTTILDQQTERQCNECNDLFESIEIAARFLASNELSKER